MQSKSNIAQVYLVVLTPLVLLFSTFPYFQLVPNEGYTQPQVYLVAALLFPFSIGAFTALRHVDIASIIWVLLIGLFGFLVSSFPYDDGQEYRYLLIYLSPFALIPVFVTTLTIFPSTTTRLLQFSIVAWLCVSVLQILVSPNFGMALLGHWSTHAEDIVSSGRGVLGFAPEPTHNAFHTLLMAGCLAVIDDSKFSRILAALAVVSAVLLAASSSGILALGLAGLVLFLVRQPLIAAFGIWFFALAIVLGNYIVGLFGDIDSRSVALIKILLENPELVLIVDYSVNVRLGGLIASFLHIFNSGFLPFGLASETWATERLFLIETYYWLFDLSGVGPPSGFGVLLFQMGFFGIPFVVWFLSLVFSSKPPSAIQNLVIFTVPFVFLSQFYISTPLFSLFCACSIVAINDRKSVKSDRSYGLNLIEANTRNDTKPQSNAGQ